MKGLGRQAPGIGVVTAAMIAIDQHLAVGQWMTRVVCKCVCTLLDAQRHQHRLVCNAAQREDDLYLRRIRKFVGKKTIAGFDLDGFRFVFWRQAFDGVGNATTVERESVISTHRLRLARKAELMQGFVKQDAGMIAGKRSPGAVGAMHAGGEADDQQSCFVVAKGHDRARMVIGVFDADIGKKAGQPFALGAVEKLFHSDRIPAMPANHRWDIFCKVVDNFGDIGVCWRLARQLVKEHDLQVRLWVDDLVPLEKLRPGVNAALAEQHIDGVNVRRWPDVFPEAEVADVVIEAFACELPQNYVNAMAARARPPVWINLEYLSAEAWVDAAHGLASPHPRLPLTKYFFFPGFTGKTGGLIREADYDERRAAFDESVFRAKLGLPPKRKDELTISLFGYENPALPSLLDAWAHDARPITCIVPESRLLTDVRAFFGDQANNMQRGQLKVCVIPFLPQDDYDKLLWLCDLNFVRGEDSFVRAQWACKPFVWHIYPQTDDAHHVKLDAFLERYVEGLPVEISSATRNFWRAWNKDGDSFRAWPIFSEAPPCLKDVALTWAVRVAKGKHLINTLLQFAEAVAAKT